jgi:succinate dehydrogenase/fumarate reductase flavoprotein subunit
VAGSVTVAGAGMAGLVAAARLRELGIEPVVVEKGTRPGGSMLLSSGVVWRHRSLEAFIADCPGADVRLQTAVVERLDEALDWLEGLGAPVLESETRNPLTIGRRFDTRGLTEALVRRAGDVRLGEPLGELADGPAILATGGFAATLARRLGLPLRASPWSEGDGLRLARGRGAGLSAGMDEFYGRALPAPPARVGEGDFVRLAQVYGALALVLDDTGTPLPGSPAWHEADLVQRIARRQSGRAWYLLDDAALAAPLRDGTVADHVEAARAAGGDVVKPDQLPFEAPDGYRWAVHVTASVTHTLGGLLVDADARVLEEDGTPLEDLYAAGVDVGGVATGGYASGLAQALVFGLVAGESAAGAR